MLNIKMNKIDKKINKKINKKIDNIECINKEKLNDELLKLSSNLNLIFKNSDDIIKKNILDTQLIKTRTKKLSFTDALCYYFNYTFINTTKLSTVSDYNYNNNINVHMSNYQKKEAIIPLLFYENAFNKIKTLYDQHKQNNKIIVGVDGTYNNINIKNTGVLETSLNM